TVNMAGKQREAKEKSARKTPKLVTEIKRVGKHAKSNTDTGIVDITKNVAPRREDIIDERFNEQLKGTLMRVKETLKASFDVIQCRRRYLHSLKAGAPPYKTNVDPATYEQQVEECKLILKRGELKKKYDEGYEKLEKMIENGEMPEILDEDQDTMIEELQERVQEEIDIQDLYWAQEGTVQEFKRTHRSLMNPSAKRTI
ncbi:hypothetical protein PFISCL1PPCAC_7726, partial [Pristionchus fissidentatus]